MKFLTHLESSIMGGKYASAHASNGKDVEKKAYAYAHLLVYGDEIVRSKTPAHGTGYEQVRGRIAPRDFCANLKVHLESFPEIGPRAKLVRDLLGQHACSGDLKKRMVEFQVAVRKLDPLCHGAEVSTAAQCCVKEIFKQNIERHLIDVSKCPAFGELLEIKELVDEIAQFKVSSHLQTSAIARWKPDTEVGFILQKALEKNKWSLEAQATLRWLALMNGPQIPFFVTWRRLRSSPHKPFAVKDTKTVSQSLNDALVESLPFRFTEKMFTVTIGKEWSSSADTSMTFHGQHQHGVSSVVKMLSEACNMAIKKAYTLDGRSIGYQVDDLMRSWVHSCADGKISESFSFLEKQMLTIDASEALWSQVKLGKENATNAMVEHMRTFFETQKERFIREKKLQVLGIRPEDIEELVDADPSFVKDYFNADKFYVFLKENNSPVLSMSPGEIQRLIDEQKEFFPLLQ